MQQRSADALQAGPGVDPEQVLAGAGIFGEGVVGGRSRAMLPSDGSSLSPAFSASRSCEATT